MPAYRIQVFGKVQGVYYRQSTCSKARQWHITGTVKNLPDGSVEICACGTEENLQQLIAWCRKGPVTASVSHVQVWPLQEQNFNEFSIKA